MAKSISELIVYPASATYGIRLDLRQDIPFPITYKVAEIRDIKKRQGARSPMPVKLPPTETNNLFFGGVFDINSTFDVFNPNVKIKAKYIINGEEEINGFIQLKTIDVDDKHPTGYNVTVFDQVATMYRQVKDKKVIDIDFTDLDHTLNLASLQSSWSGDWENTGFYYPYMYDAQTDARRVIEKFQPAIYYFTVLDRIVKQSHPDYPAKEFTWSGTIKDSVRIAREIIPYNGDKPKTSEAEAESKTMFVGRNGSYQVLNLASGGSGASSGPLVITPIPFNDESTAPFDDSNNLFNGTIFAAPSDGVYKFSENLGLSAVVDYTVSGSDNVDSEINIFAKGSLEIRDGGGNLVNPVSLGTLGTNEPYDIPAEPGANPPSTGAITGIFAVNMGVTADGSYTAGVLGPAPNITGTFQGQEEGGGIFMLAGWTARIRITLQTYQHTFVGGGSINPNLSVDNIEVFLLTGSSFRSEKIQTGYFSGINVSLQSFIDKGLKQKDILDDLVARYNAYIYTNPNDENDIIFDFRDDFFAAGPTVDWTEKKQNAKQSQIKMIGELQNAEFLLTYKAGKDWTNTTYSQLTDGDIYGQYKFLFSNEFVKGQKKVETPFEPTAFIRQILNLSTTDPSFQATAIVPSMKVIEPKTGFRVLYARSGLLTDDVSINQDGAETVQWILREKNNTTGLNIDTLITGYPYAGHYDHPINPTFSLNFGNPEIAMTEMPSSLSGSWLPPAETLFHTYWRNTMQQLARGQMMIDDFDLTPSDVAFVRKNPNLKVFVENAYFYINDLKFEANQNLRKLARVELLTVEGDLNIPSVPNPDSGFGGSYEDSGINTTKPPLQGIGILNDGGTGGNNEGRNIINSRTRGEGNNTGSGAKNVTIVGNNNTVDSNLKNVIIENGDNNYVRADNVTIRNNSGLVVEVPGVTIDGNSISSDGKIDLLFNKIDGGRNELRSSEARSKTNKLTGGKDELLSTFTESNITKIDSDDGINNIIK